MIKYDLALRKLLTRARPLNAELTPVLKSLGRVLREDICSPMSIPPFNKSAMDGYAVRSADISSATPQSPVELKVTEDIPAGSVGKKRMKKGAAARIMTGAPLPVGADAVVMVEDTEKADGCVRIMKAVEKGENIAYAGEDVRKGQRILHAGTLIGPAEMGMIAATGRDKVKVGIKPKVAVISTGDEVATPGMKLKRGQIFDANGYSLTGLAVYRGAEARFLGIARDRSGALVVKIKQARKFDILILSGGVSVGDYDLVQEILTEAGVKMLFWKVAIKPGMPTYAGVHKPGFVLALPGNPVSCMVCFELFVRPLLDVMLGKQEIGPRRGRAILMQDARMKPTRRKFLRGRLIEKGSRLYVKSASSQQSGVLRSMIESDVLIDIPENIEKVPAGSEVDIIYLE